jgi:uncharacterized membrane protein YfcA
MPQTLFGLDPRTAALLIALAVVAVGYIAVLVTGLRRMARETGEPAAPTAALTATGAVTNFFDTLGIGSFATTTTILRQFRLIRDERLPGTLNAGHALPTIAQAFIYTQTISVDPTTLIAMILAAMLGSWLGAGVVAGLPRRKIQAGMGIALLAASVLLVLKVTNVLPAGGAGTGLSGGLLVAGFVGNFVLGALMTLGIGLYAPCMILVALLGMNAKAAFPIMMGSCAFLMPFASARFIRERAVDPRAVISFALGGVPAVLVAALIVKEMPLKYVYWLVVAVVIYTAIGLLRAATRHDARDVAGTPAAASSGATPAATP